MNHDPQAFHLSSTEQRTSGFLTPIVRYLQLLSGLLAIALLAIFALSRTGLFGTPAWQVPAGAGAAAVVGLAQFPVLSLTHRGRGYWAFSLFTLVLVAWSLFLAMVWENVWPAAILIAWVPPLAALAAGVHGRHAGTAAAVSAVFTGAILWINSHSPVERLSAGNIAGTAAVILLGSTLLLFVLGTIVVRLIRYSSLQSRLVISFVLIITVPVFVTTAVSAITGLSNSQSQFADSMQAVASLKQGQIDSVVQSMTVELSSLQNGSGPASSILHVLDRGDLNDVDYRLHQSVASTLLRDVIVRHPASQYQEILVLDTAGKVVLATYTLDQGSDLANQPFFAPGSTAFFAQMERFPGKQNAGRAYKLVAAEPFYGANAQDVRGVIVAVAKSDLIFNILGPTAGLSSASTYLVNSDHKLVAAATGADAVANASPITQTISTKSPAGSNVYVNHEGHSVLGYAVWDPSINAAVVVEIPQRDVLNKSLGTVLVSALVGIFAIIIAIVAALSTSRAISDPIGKLAAVANSLSSGNLGARATVEQHDEVGELANSFNSMADQLQGVIGNLEQRIAERTDALEQQSLRLRTAAEVARDAAYAPDLDQLLEQAARLIRDRFALYHTGIFLLDEKKEFAVLRASPSDAGQQMLANRHRLRVGEQGIVGRVAATGEPRIALDTGVDPVYFNNPLLPGTHSEMALPLKTADGTIGVIDIQSDQPEAFTQDDIAIIQVMADQLATAIQRTRLLQQVRAQLGQLEQTNEAYTERSWRAFEHGGRQTLGYRFDNVRLESIKTTSEGPGGASRAPVGAQQNSQTIEVPIRLRGQIIGTVNLRFQSAHAPEVTLSMIQQIADRLASALENARLLEDSVRRANKERVIGEITTKISASVNMRNILQTAVEELGRAIPGSDVLVQLTPDTEL